ncbi:MAG: polysaccharide pyruvyl transferase family protein [Armatimonadota bacterium]
MGRRCFVLAGHAGFYNRGCEAIARATSQMLRERFPGCELVLVSDDIENDLSHGAAEGLTVLDSYAHRWSREWFGWQLRKLLAQPVPPSERVPLAVRRAIQGADAVLQIGGDNFTSDYGLTPNSALLGINETALAHDVPLVVWGATIGPFDRTDLEQVVLSHLRRAALITVRESITEEYLRRHGIADNVVRVADPAMLLEAEPIDLSPFWPKGERVLALNVSALSCRYRADGDLAFGQRLLQALIDEVMSWNDWGVLLVPHVIGPAHNNDHQYMAEIGTSGSDRHRVRLVPPVLDARQTKFVISHCDALMAARTHATIAGFTSAVPTISLAYSTKAHGINLDVFGHAQWLLDIRHMHGPDEAVCLLKRLVAQRDAVAAHLRQRIAQMKQCARRGAQELARVLGEGSA